MSACLSQELLAPGQAWSRVLRRHQALRLHDQHGGANVAALFFNAAAPVERYNMPDTLKAQYTAYLTRGHTLMSDMGHVLASIIEDTCGWHDTLTGHQDADEAERHYGVGRYATLRNACHRNTRDNFLIELAKHELGVRDLHANVNFFTRVTCDDDGVLRLDEHRRANTEVVVRAEMDVLVILSNTPHPMASSRTWAPPPVTLRIDRVAAPGPDDICRVSREENRRAFQLTEGLFA